MIFLCLYVVVLVWLLLCMDIEYFSNYCPRGSLSLHQVNFPKERFENISEEAKEFIKVRCRRARLR